MRKVLFISYFWPPSVKASLHWPLKMIKFLPEFGWQPSVLTVEQDTFSSKDESFLKDINKNVEVIKAYSFEPFKIYKKFTGRENDEQLVASETISTVNKSLTHLISIWIRMNLFIPDARIGWYYPAVKKGSAYLEKEDIEVLISIGPPHTTHLVGMKLSRKFKIPHIPVFIDPWVDIVYYKNFKRSKPTRFIDNYLEKRVFQNSKSDIFVTRTMCEDYIRKYHFLKDKSHVLYWGYDEEDFSDISSEIQSTEETIVHAGNIFDFQNTPGFWKQVKTEIDKGRKLKIKFIGTVSPGIKQTIENTGLNLHTEYLGFLPYNEMLKELSKASYLLVCATESRHVPGKLFEYLRTGKPIIAFGNDNVEVKKILEETNAGIMFNYDQNRQDYFKELNQLKTNQSEVIVFERKNIAKELSNILDESIFNFKQ
jgi:glycosyltransferase involved in cell wall biosynthesis